MASKKRVLKYVKTGALSLPAGHPFAATVEPPTSTVTLEAVTPTVTPTVTLEAVTLEAPRVATPTPVKKKSTRKKKTVKK